MKNFLKYFLFLTLFVTSCKDEDRGEGPVNFFFTSYFVPQTIEASQIIDSQINCFSLSSVEYITEKNDSSRFYKLAREFGEYGDKQYPSIPPCPSSKPIGIKTIMINKIEGNEKFDVSSHSVISYFNPSSFILSNQSSTIGMVDYMVEKKVSDLTEFDYKWMYESFSIALDFQNEGNVYIVISLDNGTEIEQRLLY